MVEGAVGGAVGVYVPAGYRWVVRSIDIYWDASAPNYALAYVVSVGGHVTGIYSFGTDGLSPKTGHWDGHAVLYPGDAFVAALQVGADTFGILAGGYQLSD